MLGKLCFDKSVDDRTAAVHGLMVKLGKKYTSEWRDIVTALYKPLSEAMTKAGLKAPQRRKVIAEFWKVVPKELIPERAFIRASDMSPRGLNWFFKQFLKFYDRETGKFDTAGLMKKLDKSARFRKAYFRVKRLADVYVDEAMKEMPDGTEIPLETFLAKMHGLDEAVPVGTNVGEVRPGSIVDMLSPAIEGAKELSSWDVLNEVFTGTWISKMLPSKGFFRRLGQRFGKEYSRIWEQGEKRRIAFNNDMAEAEKEIVEIFGEHLHNNRLRERITYIAENAHQNPEHPMYEYMRKNPPNSEELAIASRVRAFFDKYGKRFGVPEEWWLEHYMPRVRERGSFDIPDIIEDKDFRPLLRRFFMYERTGNLNPREVDSLQLMRQYVRVGLKYEKFEGDGWMDEMRGLLDGLRGHGREHFIVANYLADVSSSLSNRLAFHLQATRILAKAVGRVIGVEPKEIESIGPLFLQGIYSAGLGLRVVPLLKQVAQTLVEGGAFLGKYLADGIRMAANREAWEYVRKLGIPVERFGAVGLGGEIEEALGTVSSRKISAIRKWLNMTTRAYVRADTLNRVVDFWGGKRMFEEETKRLWEGKISLEKWKKKVRFHWFDGFGDLQEGMLEVAKRKGDLKALQAVGDEFGRHVTEDVNWVYRTGNAPLLMREHPYVFQFGTWPANFADYLMRMVEYGVKTKDFSMLGRLVGIGGGLFSVGASAGLDLRGLLAYPSLFYTGGPIPHAALDFAAWMMSEYYGSPLAGLRKSDFLRDLTMFLPVGLAGRAFVEGMEEEDLAKVFGIERLLDFIK